MRLSFDAPGATTLVEGWPSSFPRINGYLLIPTEAGATIGMITEVTIERATVPQGPNALGLVNLPQPSRLLSLVPLGTLVEVNPENGNGAGSYKVRRGVDVFPSVGDSVLLPTKLQMQAMVEGEGTNTSSGGRVLLGTCPTAAGASVYFDPDKLFGRHLAILGNTGSGKSCSVAGIIRWSLAGAREARQDGANPNARFIILDPNGEYGRAFKDLEAAGKLRRFGVEISDQTHLQVPAWFWNAEEWASFTAAAPGVQRPLLYDALRALKGSGSNRESLKLSSLEIARQYKQQVDRRRSQNEFSENPKAFGDFLVTAKSEFDKEANSKPGERSTYTSCTELIARMISKASSTSTRGATFYEPFLVRDVDELTTVLGQMVETLESQSPPSIYNRIQCEDIPRPFAVTQLAPIIESLGRSRQGRDIAMFVDTLRLRIESMLGSQILSSIVDPDSDSIGLAEWLDLYIGGNQAENGPIAIIDLSLVPSEIIHIVVAVLSRMIFEALQRYRRASPTNKPSELPTVLVLDEAHTFIHRDLLREGANPAGNMCCRTFERIAREGRKFGLGLVLASQRPSEVSPTVLSQCNTFLLHRLVNDLDQQLVRSLVPDGLGDMLRELPSLPSRRAILLGWAAPAPILVEVREIEKDQRPWSPDPPYWAVWTGQEKRDIDWSSIARAWSGEAYPASQPTPAPGSSDTNESNLKPIQEDEIPF